MRLALLPLLAIALPTPASSQTPAPSSRYSLLDDCEVVAFGDVDAGEDWIAHRCEGLAGIPVWLSFSDSARSTLGFGSEQNLSGIFAPEREASWPIEWRGMERETGFEPFATIVRMQRPDAGISGDGAGLLFVFRLRDDGTSCLIGSDIVSNEAARRIADGAQGDFQCISEPFLPVFEDPPIRLKS